VTETTATASRIGRFTLSRRLGKNPIATVYRAHDSRDKCDVAIKLIHSQIDSDAALQTIRAQQLDQVRHPAVCRLCSVDQHQGLSYLAYEYADGPSLAETLAGNGLQSCDKLPLMRTLVEGLAALHEHGVCHLGVTPARIKVTGGNMPKILSIGRLSLLEAAGKSTTVKRSELRYMAPEQLVTGAGDERTDVFRLCLVLFEIISRKPVLNPKSTKEAREQLKTLALAPDALGTSHAAMKLMTFLSKGLATDPEQRYPNAIQMLAAMPKVRAKHKSTAQTQANAAKAAPPSAKVQADSGRGDAVEPPTSATDIDVGQHAPIGTQAADADAVSDVGDNATTAGRHASHEVDSESINEDQDQSPSASEQRSSAETPKPPLGHDNSDGTQTLAYILDRLANNNDFPALSQSIFEVNQLTSLQANATVSQIAEVILRDYALSNKLLKLANSAYYGVRIEVTRVTDAIRLLGFEQVRITANGLAYTAKIGPGMEKLRDAMLKSFASGLVARQLADDVQLNDSEEAFLCAMFHDTGEHLTIHYLPEAHAQVVDLLKSGHAQNKADAATQVFGLTFASLGAAAARSWRFPEKIVTAIEGETADGEPLNDAQLLQLSWIARGANDLCDLAGQYLPNEADAALQALVERLKEHLPLDTTHLKHALHQAAEKAQTFAPVLGIDADKSDYMQALAHWGPPPPVESLDTGPAPRPSAETESSAEPGGDQQKTMLSEAAS
jgi:HD-like signal output (HDOD) protein